MNTFVEFFKEFSPSYRFLKNQRELWGGFKDKFRNMKDIALLHQLTVSQANRYGVDDDTWADLDMDKLYSRIDICATPIGRQFLYRKMRHGNRKEGELKSDFESAMVLQSEKSLREKIQLILFGLTDPEASRVTRVLFEKLPRTTFPKTIVPVMAVSVPIATILALFLIIPFWFPVVFALLNFVFAQYYANDITWFATGFVFLKALLYAAKNLSEIDDAKNIPALLSLQNISGAIRDLRKKARFSGADANNTVSIHAAYWGYFLNIICLFDFFVFLKSSKVVAENRAELIKIYEFVASIDATISVASYCRQSDYYCNPTFNNENHIFFDGLKHPLVENAVPNSYDNKSKSAIITGSNMAGKTTFIKSVGVNMILARSLWICHAKAAKLPRCKVVSSIKRSDALLDNKSYYKAEIDALLRFISVDKNNPTVFIVDEILRGTNTVERLAASTAILEALCDKGVTLVTTHDIELCDLLPNKFDLYHFHETSDINKMFDYKIKEGRVTTRNAINLLEQIGFPENTIQRARTIAKQLN